MSRFARLMLALTALSMTTAARAAAGDCYQLEDDGTFGTHPDWTITHTDGIEMIWNRGGEKVVLMTGSTGTGMPNRIADEPDKTRHIYRYLDDMLLFDMNIYCRGCTGGAPKRPDETEDEENAVNCYVSEEDPSATLTEEDTAYSPTFVWQHGETRENLATYGSVGPSRNAVIATGPHGPEHNILRVDDDAIVMDMSLYRRGCPK